MTPAPALRGHPREVALTVAASIVTLGLWAAWTYFITFREVDHQAGRRHSALFFLAFVPVVGQVFALLYLRAELAGLRADRQRLGLAPGVSFGACVAWSTLGLLVLVGPLVCLAKVQGSINGYWVELYARHGIPLPSPDAAGAA